MKKRALLMLNILCISLILIPLSLAEITSVAVEPKASTVLVESNNSANFNLIINSTQDDEIEIYALAGMVIEPYSPTEIKRGGNILEIKAYPSEVLKKQRGTYDFEYKIRDKSGKIITNYLKISIVELKDALSFRTLDINYADKEAKIIVRNLHDAHLENIKINFSSSFFEGQKTISLKPNEEVTISLPIKEGIGSIPAGSYVLKASASARDTSANFDSSFSYIQKEDIKEESNSQGIIIRKGVVEKTNEGNVPANVQVTMSKDIFSRLFTMHSIEPAKTERSGFKVIYTWEKRLEPSQKLSVNTTTNYTLPFLLAIFIIIIILLIYSYTRTNIVLTKRVSYVKTKGGEFALKVRIHAKARKFVEDIQIIDKLPGMTTLYEKFGSKPNKIEHSTRRLFWNIERLNAGEERVFSYIIYSKMKVVGKFELPPAQAAFSREGKTHKVSSNRTFFVADTMRSRD